MPVPRDAEHVVREYVARQADADECHHDRPRHLPRGKGQQGVHFGLRSTLVFLVSVLLFLLLPSGNVAKSGGRQIVRGRGRMYGNKSEKDVGPVKLRLGDEKARGRGSC